MFKRTFFWSVTAVAVALMISACGSGGGGDYVEINGVKWATRNVGEKGKFVANPEDYGECYTWEEAKNACPSGWRLPTREEFDMLLSGSSNEWTTVKGVEGRVFKKGSNSVFLPACGVYYSNNLVGTFEVGEKGSYWSGQDAADKAYILHYGKEYAPFSDKTFYKISGCSVRCVKE
jgi:uncharacterized protein (TIGR02145 family)